MPFSMSLAFDCKTESKELPIRSNQEGIPPLTVPHLQNRFQLDSTTLSEHPARWQKSIKQLYIIYNWMHGWGQRKRTPTQRQQGGNRNVSSEEYGKQGLCEPKDAQLQMLSFERLSSRFALTETRCSHVRAHTTARASKPTSQQAGSQR